MCHRGCRPTLFIYYTEWRWMRVTKREKGQKIGFTRGWSGSRPQCTTYSFLPAFLKFIKPIKPLISYLQGDYTFTSQLLTPRYPRRTWSVRGESELWCLNGEIVKLQSLQSQLVGARKSASNNLSLTSTVLYPMHIVERSQ